MSEHDCPRSDDGHTVDGAPQHLVVFQPSGRRGYVREGVTLLEAARLLGVEIESICGGRQTCGKCKVAVEEGWFPKYGFQSGWAHLSSPTQREVRYRERYGLEPGYRLACSARVLGDVLVTVPEESQARKQIIRKGAVERAIEIDPAVKMYYLELAPATLQDHRGDWERITDELCECFGVEDVQPDPIILPTLQRIVRRADWKVTVAVWDNGQEPPQVIRVAPGYHEQAYGLAVDVGTTTVAAHLCDLRTGQILATEAMMNPQVVFGEDLMSRVSYGMIHEDGVTRMHQAIVEGLNTLAERAAARAGIATEEVLELVLVGNTVMHHLLLGIDPVELGGSPFAPALRSPLDLKARELGLCVAPGANVHVLPVEAGHVGADNVAVVLAEEPHRVPPDEIVLIIDVGTNGEILLGNRDRLLSASSPTGPAFEGAQIRHGMRAAPGAIERVRVDPATLEVKFKVIGEDRWSDEWSEENPPAQLPRGICGSGIIEAVAELLRANVLEPNGRFVQGLTTPRFRPDKRKGEFVVAWPHQTSTGREIVVHTDDVRAIQLAKAALYAGAKLLMNRLGVQTVDRIVLAGAFGSYIDKEHAMIIGMIPDCDMSRVYAVGNAAGDGARIALLSRAKRREAAQVARWIEYVETAAEPTFQEEFVAAIPFPHMHDPFPHLASLLGSEFPMSQAARC